LAEALKELIGLLKRPLERMWHALSHERIEQERIDKAAEIFAGSLEAKKFATEKLKASLTTEEIEKERKEAYRNISRPEPPNS
jgi:hypothetical protein